MRKRVRTRFWWDATQPLGILQQIQRLGNFLWWANGRSLLAVSDTFVLVEVVYDECEAEHAERL